MGYGRDKSNFLFSPIRLLSFNKPPQPHSVSTLVLCLCNETTARKKLWNGLTNDEFLRTLRKLMAEHVTDASTYQVLQ